MGGILGGKGKGGSSTSIEPLPTFQTKSQELVLDANTARGLNSRLAGIGKATSYYDPISKQVISSTRLNPYSKLALSGVQEDLANYQNLAATEADRAKNAYYNPMMADIKRQLGTMFSNIGVSGKGNSMAQGVMNRFAEEAARNQAKAFYELENEAKNQLLQQLTGRSALAYQPAQMLAGLSSEQAGNVNANMLNYGNQLANLFSKQQDSTIQAAQSDREAQMRKDEAEAARKERSGSGLSSLLSGGLGLLSSFLPMPG